VGKRRSEPGTAGDSEELDPRMNNAAVLTRRNGVIIQPFVGWSKKSGEWRRKAIGQIPGATRGTFHPIARYRKEQVIGRKT